MKPTLSERLIAWSVIAILGAVIGVAFGVAISAELDKEPHYDVPAAVRDSKAGAVEQRHRYR